MTRRKLFVGFFLLILLGRSVLANTDSISSPHRHDPYALTDYFGTILLPDNGAASHLLASSIIDVSVSNRFCIKELTDARVGAVFRFRQNSFLFSCNHLGHSRFGELSAHLGYARSFGRHFSASTRFYYLMTHAEEYKSTHSVTFDLSLYASIGKNFGLGFSCYNPAGLKYGIVGKSRLPMVLQLDFQYFLGPNLLLYSQIRQELKSRIAIRLGTAVKLKKIHLNIAVGFPEPLVRVDVNVHVRRFILGADCQYRPAIGPVLGANFQLLL